MLHPDATEPLGIPFPGDICKRTQLGELIYCVRRTDLDSRIDRILMFRYCTKVGHLVTSYSRDHSLNQLLGF